MNHLIKITGVLIFISSGSNISAQTPSNRGTPNLSIPAARVVFRGKIPFLCLLVPTLPDCRQFGDLHNEALAATYEPIRDGRNVTVEFSRMVERLRAWGPRAGPLSGYLASRPGPDAAARMIAKHLGDAGITDKRGRVLPGAFNDTARMTAYLERKRIVGPELAAVLRDAGRERIGASELARRIEARTWRGPDIVRSQLLVNMLRASDSFWSRRAEEGRRQVGPGPGFWDAVGGLLTFELGPGSIVGGYLMSCASAGQWL